MLEFILFLIILIVPAILLEKLLDKLGIYIPGWAARLYSPVIALLFLGWVGTAYIIWEALLKFLGIYE